jgi:hypothetical protein
VHAADDGERGGATINRVSLDGGHTAAPPLHPLQHCSFPRWQVARARRVRLFACNCTFRCTLSTLRRDQERAKMQGKTPARQDGCRIQYMR